MTPVVKAVRTLDFADFLIHCFLTFQYVLQTGLARRDAETLDHHATVDHHEKDAQAPRVQSVQLLELGLIWLVVELDEEEDCHEEEGRVCLKPLVDLCVENDDYEQDDLLNEDEELPVEEGTYARSITHVHRNTFACNGC